MENNYTHAARPPLDNPFNAAVGMPSHIRMTSNNTKLDYISNDDDFWYSTSENPRNKQKKKK